MNAVGKVFHAIAQILHRQYLRDDGKPQPGTAVLGVDIPVKFCPDFR